MILACLTAVWLSGALTVRSAEVDITPPEPLPLGGYTARGNKVFEPGGDHLYARAVLLSEGKVHLAIVSAEMLTIPQSLYREVKKRIPSDVTLFLSATHTHSAPDSQMLNDKMTFSLPGIASYKPRWLEWYADKIASAVKSAEDAEPKPQKADHLTVAEAKEELNRGRRESAVPDETATLVTAHFRFGSGPKPLFMSYAAHATFLGPENMRLSGDWPGAFSQLSGCLVLPGAIGDVSPHATGDTPQARIGNFCARLTFDLDSSRVKTYTDLPLTSVSQPIPLDPVHAHPTMGAYYKSPQWMAEQVVHNFAQTDAAITAFRIGKLAVVGVPGEPTSHLGRAIKAYGMEIGFDEVLVVSHVNGWMGYILDAGDYDRGGYEATLSFYGRDEGEKVVRAAQAALRKLAGR